MIFFEILKLIAETITAISAAVIVIIHLKNKLPIAIKNFFIQTIPIFFKGFSIENDKKVRFFKALKLQKEQKQQYKDILKALKPNLSTEEVLILNKAELFEALLNSKIITKISLTKKDGL